MSAEQPEGGKSYLWFAAVVLALYCVAITAVTGDIGFDGDDWWVLAIPYWHSFPDSVALYASKFLRPMEGFYWISLFELFGFNRIGFHLCSLLLLAGSALLMGVSLDRAFPGRRTGISIAVLLAFFLPPVSCLTYIMFTDNSRLCMVFFWACVLAFQRWAQKSPTWKGLTLPVALYVLSFLTYEAPSFLIFLVPLLVWPVYKRTSGRVSDRLFLLKLCVGIASAFAAAVALRFVFLDGGAVEPSNLLPPFELLWSYLALLPFYLLAPFASMSADGWAVAAGMLVLLATAGLLLFSRSRGPALGLASDNRFDPKSQWCMVALGVGILLLGMLPYQVAGYGHFSPTLVDTLKAKCGLLPQGDLSWFNFTWSSRIYSSASFGVAILLSAGLSQWRKPVANLVGKVAALVIIGFMAVFHAGLSLDWREAAEIRSDLIRSLVTQVPAVTPGTNFVLLNIDCSHKRAEVIRRENGLRELIEMLYGDQTLGAWRLYPYAYDQRSHVNQQAVATPWGFLCGDSQRQSQQAPHETLLLFKRWGRTLVLLDRITARDGSVPTGIAWNGIDRLTSNFARIEAWRKVAFPRARFARNAWTTGLISTFQLQRIKSTTAYLEAPKYDVVHFARPRRFLRMRLSQAKARL